MRGAAFKAHGRIGFWKADLLRKGPAAAAALAGLDSVGQVRALPSGAALTALVQGAVKLNEDGVLAEWQKAQQERRKNPVPVKPPPACLRGLWNETLPYVTRPNINSLQDLSEVKLEPRQNGVTDDDRGLVDTLKKSNCPIGHIRESNYRGKRPDFSTNDVNEPAFR